MMYQIRTFFPLCCSKNYCDTRALAQQHLANVVKATNELREGMDEDECLRYGWNHPVTPTEIGIGAEMIEIDETKFLNWEKYFGAEQDITAPLLRIEKDKKVFPKMKLNERA